MSACITMGLSVMSILQSAVNETSDSCPTFYIFTPSCRVELLAVLPVALIENIYK